MCVSVCPRAYRPHARSLPIFMHAAYCRGSVLLRRGDEFPRGTILSVFFPIDNALFGTYTKTAEPIKMPFGVMTQAGPRYHVSDRDSIPQGKGQFWGET